MTRVSIEINTVPGAAKGALRADVATGAATALVAERIDALALTTAPEVEADPRSVRKVVAYRGTPLLAFAAVVCVLLETADAGSTAARLG